MALEDSTMGKGCSEKASMSMGSPDYAQFMGEDPVLDSSNPVVPPFYSVTFNDLLVGAQFGMLKFPTTAFNGNSSAQVGSLDFSAGPCNPDVSCCSKAYS